MKMKIMKKLKVLLALCLLCTAVGGCAAPESVEVPILMFHDVTEQGGGVWGMSEENFRDKVEFLLERGYTPVSFEQLVAFADGEGPLPEKPVCITLDDGYYSNYEYVLPLAEELQVPMTVFMTCDTVRPAGEKPYEGLNNYCKVDAEELRAIEESPYMLAQSHTYGLHGENTSYSEQVRDNSLPIDGEEESEYKEMFARDCEAAEGVLAASGVEENIVFSYPSGKSNEWAEEVLRERGYRASVTTDYGHRNTVTEGDGGSLFLLGRMNVNDGTGEEELLDYLERRERDNVMTAILDWIVKNVLEATWYGWKEVLTVFLTSMVPVLELRGAIMFGPEHNMPWLITYIVAVLGNILPVPFIILFIRKIFDLMRKYRIFGGIVDKMEAKADKHKAAVMKYAGWGLYLFVAIPLPGTGAWTGSLVAAMLDMRFKSAFPAIAGGVATAGMIMTAFYYGLQNMFPWMTLWHVIGVVLVIVALILAITWLWGKKKSQ